MRRYIFTALTAAYALAGCATSGGAGLPHTAGIAARTLVPAGSKPGKITFFKDDYADPVPQGITAGPDGALWFTDSGNDTIGRMTTHGQFKFYHTGVEVSVGITTGPDGALWFTVAQGPSNPLVGRITTGGTVTFFSDPGGSYPQGITTGPDGALWFGEMNGTIGRMTTAGAVMHFKVASPRATIESIVSGPDGALWATRTGNHIRGAVIRLAITAQVQTWPDQGGPQFICVGPDKALWFTEFAGEIGRITTGGAITNFPVNHGSYNAFLGGIAAGADGALWFVIDSTHGGSAIGRMTTAGKAKYYDFPASGTPELYGVTAGPLHDIWFTSAASPTGVGSITTL